VQRCPFLARRAASAGGPLRLEPVFEVNSSIPDEAWRRSDRSSSEAPRSSASPISQRRSSRPSVSICRGKLTQRRMLRPGGSATRIHRVAEHRSNRRILRHIRREACRPHALFLAHKIPVNKLFLPNERQPERVHGKEGVTSSSLVPGLRGTAANRPLLGADFALTARLRDPEFCH
jgi:hypothetical protein